MSSIRQKYFLVPIAVEAPGIVVVEPLYYKPEGCGFETSSDEFIFSIYLILPGALGLRVYSASYRNEYQKQKNTVSGEQSAAGA
jgi:hypothetical protein